MLNNDNILPTTAEKHNMNIITKYYKIVIQKLAKNNNSPTDRVYLSFHNRKTANKCISKDALIIKTLSPNNLRIHPDVITKNNIVMGCTKL